MANQKKFEYRIDHEKYVPMGSWLLGGVKSPKREEIIKHLIEKQDWYAYYFNKRVIAPISDFYLPRNIVDFAIVEEYNYIYFSIKDQPSRLYAQVIPDVRNTEMFVQDKNVLEGMHDEGFDLKVLPSIRFDEDIISIHSTTQNLYVMTANRSRHKSDENMIMHKIAIHAQVGFQSTGHLKRKVNLPQNWQDYKLKNRNLPTSVSIIEEKPYNSIVYISGPCKPYLCKGQIAPNSPAIDLIEIQFDEKTLKQERLPLTLVNHNRYESFYASDEPTHKFYLSGIDSNCIYSITIKGIKGSINKHFEDKNHEIQYFSMLSVNLQNQPGLEKKTIDVCTKMLLGYDRKQKRIVSVYKVGNRLEILPIMGGGDVPLFNKKLHKNMLDYDLPNINKLIVFPDVCILAGDTETMTWFTVQLPRRLFALSFYEENPKSTLNPENYIS